MHDKGFSKYWDPVSLLITEFCSFLFGIGTIHRIFIYRTNPSKSIMQYNIAAAELLIDKFYMQIVRMWETAMQRGMYSH